MNGKGWYQSQQPRTKGMPHPTGVLIHVWLAFKLIEFLLAHFSLNVADTANCGVWIAYHKDPNTDLAKSSLQLVVIKHMKGDGQGNDRNGAVLIKLRPHLDVMECWAPVMTVLGRSDVELVAAEGTAADRRAPTPPTPPR